MFCDGVGGVHGAEAAAGDVEVAEFCADEGSEEGGEESCEEEGRGGAVSRNPQGDGAEEFAPGEDMGEVFGGGPRDEVVVLDGGHERAWVGDFRQGGCEEDEREDGSDEESDYSDGHARKPPSSR